MRLAFVVLLLTVAAAHAEPPPSDLTVTAGVGVAISHLSDEFLDAGFTTGASFRLDLAYRLNPHLAIGVHFGLAQGQGLQYESFVEGQAPCPPSTYEFGYTAFELGGTAQLAFDRFWVAPWIGSSALGGDEGDLETWGTSTLGYGIAIGYGVYALPQGHYIDAYASAMRSLKDIDYPGPRDPFVSFNFGVAYRY